MAELRYNPLLGDYVMIASHRQARPQMPKNYCPFCPGSGKVPDNYDVHKYDNDFPALSFEPPYPDAVDNGKLFKTAPAIGKCEVILYSPDHTTTLPELPVEHIAKLVALWQERMKDIAENKKIKYIMPFENKGEVVGVTMPHPHGQIYGYSWIPLRVKRKIEMAASYYNVNCRNLFMDMIEQEIEAKVRVIFENEHFICFLPFASEYPYGIMIMPKKQTISITDFSKEESTSLADALKKATSTLDLLFDMKFPYMMCMYSAPVNDGFNYNDIWNYHIEFFPPMRTKEKQKFNASSETGAWAPCNPTSPEEMAAQLRTAYIRLMGM